MTNIWFTSDCHYFHKNILKFCPDTRPCKDVQEMNDELIYNHNQLVKPQDHWYHLGDFSFGSLEETVGVIKRLNGQKHFILGNHDEHLVQGSCRRLMQSLDVQKIIKVDGHKIIMYHYPVWEWLHCHRGSWSLFGHVHSNYKTVRGKSMNVGIDTRTDMSPYNYDEIVQFMADKPLIDHHNNED